jgi:formate dehydrogenase subunit gamma
MELFRVVRNPWGQEILIGVSWDLLWLFVGAGALFILAHLAYMLIFARARPRDPDEDGGSVAS